MNQTVHSILDSAETRIKREGFDAVSYADIAKDVGIRKASIHYHFRTKGDLSLVLIERYHNQIIEQLKGISQKEPRATARLLAFLTLYRDAMESGRSLCLCVALSVTQQALPGETRSRLTRFHDDVAGWLEEVFRQGQRDDSIHGVADPYAEAYAALAQIEGAQIIARSARDPARFEAAIDTLRRRLI